MASSGTRNLKLDNAKGVLIFLVLIAHFSERGGGWDSPGRMLVLDWINIFTMPAFVFLAGVTSKPKDILRRLLILGVMLIFFQIVYQAQEIFREGDMRGSLLEPFWLLWFLMAMIWYTLITPLIFKVPPLVAMTVSIAAALGAGLLPFIDGRLTGSRTLVFLPFFVAGVLYGPKLLKMEFPRYVLPVAVAVILGMGTLLWLADLPEQWIHATRGYARLDAGPLEGIGIRAVLLLAAGIGTVLFVAATTSKQTILTTAGRTSLSIFLLHGLIAMALASTFTRYEHLGDWLLIPVLIIAVVLAALLGREKPDKIIRDCAVACADFVLSVGARLSARFKPAEGVSK